MENYIDENGMFKLPNDKINFNINIKNAPENIINKYKEDNNISNFISLSNCPNIAKDINNKITNISMDIISFIISKCGYETSSKEYKQTIINTIKDFLEINKIK
jgi:hypothetical protein